MLELLADWFSTEPFMPHAMCLVWRQDSSGCMWSRRLDCLSYFSIPFALIYFVRKRTDSGVSWMFCCCGVHPGCGPPSLCCLGHVVSGLCVAGIGQGRDGRRVGSKRRALMAPNPKALALPSPAQLASANTQLRERRRVPNLSENALDADRLADTSAKYVLEASGGVCSATGPRRVWGELA